MRSAAYVQLMRYIWLCWESVDDVTVTSVPIRSAMRLAGVSMTMCVWAGLPADVVVSITADVEARVAALTVTMCT